MKLGHVIIQIKNPNGWHTVFGGTMKKTSLLCLNVLFVLSTLGQASQFASSRISEVTLYANQAMVVREGQTH